MAGRGWRTLIRFGAAIALALSWALAAAPQAAAADCPAPPFTPAAVLSVPEDERATCFGRTEIAFTAQGGLLEAVFGVEMPVGFGQPVWLATGTGGYELIGWKPLGLELPTADARALGMTSPGMGLDGWTHVWWRVSGHFDDPMAAGCRLGTNGTPSVSTPEALAWCQDQLVIDSMAWLEVPRTDAAPATAAGGITGGALVGLAIIVFVLALAGAGPHRRHPIR